eukprot:1932659-Ditylum_brightwellii.AAC.1
MGQTIHLTSIEADHCPTKALSHRINHILQHGGREDAPLCAYYQDHHFQHITPEHLVNLLRTAVKSLKLHEAGIDPNLIGVHSLRAGRAMALKLQGEADTTIMKHGRWTSLTFLQYIHNQIG